MPLDRDLEQRPISKLVEEEGNVIGQPGGGPLAGRIPNEISQRFVSIQQAASNAAGIAGLDLGAPFIGFSWLVERISVTGAGSVDFYVDSVNPTSLVDFTAAGTKDISDEFSPIYVPGGQHFLAVFTGAGVGTLCTCRIQVRLVKDGN